MSLLWDELLTLLGWGEPASHQTDPGEYDAEEEDERRGLMELLAFYDESGPRSDPTGRYLCGTCRLRQEPDRCLWVSSTISMTTGGCKLYVRGDQLGDEFALLGKYTQTESGYAERPKAKRFGCGMCSYASAANEADDDGRVLWCKEWGVHVRSEACCERHEGPDMVIAPGEHARKETGHDE